MLRKYNINGAMYEYDMDHISIRDALAIKAKTGLNLIPFSRGLSDLDPGCIQALGWVMLTNAGQNLTIEDVDFDLNDFFADEEESDDETDPTSPGGLTAGSTSPLPESDMP